jgi:poly(A) polymerase
MPPAIDLAAARRFAVEVVRQLRGAGFEALWAGGCVRDQVLGKTPKDYDVATNARPDQVRALFGKRKTLAIGAAFGVIGVLGPKGAGTIEVATFRRDAAYSDGRHPDSVVFSTAEEDAQRRDFTINGLFYDPMAEQVIDYVGGVADLERQIVRAIRDPHERFAEDKLRMLRAVRFAVTFGFELEAETLAAIVEHAAEIRIVSVERIAAELRRMLVHPRRSEALRLLHVSGLLAQIWPEAAIADTTSRVWALLDSLAEPCFSIVLASIIRETAAPSAEPVALVEMAERVCRRWRLSNEEREMAQWALAHEREVRAAHVLPWSRIQRILVSSHVQPLLQFAEAVARVEHGDLAGVELCRAKLALPPDELDPPPLIGGNDLKHAGIRPGPRYRELIEQVRDAQLDGAIRTREEALAWVRETLGEASGAG